MKVGSLEICLSTDFSETNDFSLFVLYFFKRDKKSRGHLFCIKYTQFLYEIATELISIQKKCLFCRNQYVLYDTKHKTLEVQQGFVVWVWLNTLILI